MQIPLVVRTRCGALLALSIFYLFATFIGVFVVAVPTWIIFLRPDNVILYQTLIMLPVGLYVSLLGPAIIWTAMSDAANAAPVLKLTDIGIEDFRIGLEARWADVKNTKRTYYKGSLKGIRIDFLHPIVIQKWSFRIGSSMWPWSRRPHEAYVPLIFLDAPAATLADAIESLVIDHGGRTQS